LAPVCIAAGTGRPVGKQFLGGMRIPGVRAFALEPVNDVAERGKVLEPLAAFIAIENHQGHAPYALPRNTPVGTMRNHFVNTFAAPFGRPFHFGDFVERQLAQGRGFGSWYRSASVVELYKPLFGGPKDH